MISYSLPYPVSVNGLFVEVGGKRIKTRSYREWRTEAGWAIKMQGKKSVKGPVSIVMECAAPDKRRRDISNLIKAVEDLLVEMQVIEDDSLVIEVTARWIIQGPACTVLVMPYLLWAGEQFGLPAPSE